MTSSTSESIEIANSKKKRLLQLMLKKKGLQNKSSVVGIQPRTDLTDLALSNTQKRMWFFEQFNKDTLAYVFCYQLDFLGNLNIEYLREAYQIIVDRHDIFRTSYPEKDGVPYQKIHLESKIDFPLFDLSTLEDDDREIQLKGIINRESTTLFDLEKLPLMRMCIVKLSDDHHIVLQSIHHIVFDGWSLGVIHKELKNIYESLLNDDVHTLTDLDIQYADYASWNIKEADSPLILDKAAFWKNYLGGNLPILELPIDKQRPTNQSFAGALLPIQLSHELSDQVRKFAIEQNSTVFMVLLTAFKILLYRYSDETDLIVGTPVANRASSQLEKLVGLFVNSIAIRTNIDSESDVVSLLKQVTKSSTEAITNQSYPFEKIVDDLNIERVINQNPIFQVMFGFESNDDFPSAIGDAGLTINAIDNGSSVFDLFLSLIDSPTSITGYFEYSTDIFESTTIERMASHFINIVQSMLQNPNQNIQYVTLLSQKEHTKMLINWNQTSTPYPQTQTIYQLFEDVVVKNPNLTAICSQDIRISYDELNEKSNQLARYLQAQGVQPDMIIGICIERSIEMFIAILGVLKSGGAYLPLDPEYPTDRLAYMLDDSAANILITKQALKNNLPDHQATLICIDEQWGEIAKLDKNNLSLSVSVENLAYIIYTSGSTGNPKGVMISHRNLVHSTSSRIEYYPNKIERFLLLSSFSFDSSVAGIFWTLIQGGELHLPSQGDEKDIQQIAHLLHSVKATHMLSLPSIYSLLLNIADMDQLASLNTVIVAGEICPLDLKEHHNNKLDGAYLYNEYGPTEGSVWSSVYDVTEHQSSLVPIGKPIANVQIFILSRALQPVPIGVVGEIYIAGAGVARGYLNRDDLTAEKFIDNPFTTGKLYKTGDQAKFIEDGNILFCGRNDDQVKIRGYRIELGEIEHALVKHEYVDEAVVIAKQNTQMNEPEITDIEEYILTQLMSMETAEAEELLLDLEQNS